MITKECNDDGKGDNVYGGDDDNEGGADGDCGVDDDDSDGNYNADEDDADNHEDNDKGLKNLPQLVRKLFQRLITAIPSQPTDMWKLLALLPCLMLVAEVKGDCSELLACENIIFDVNVTLVDLGLFSMIDETEAVDNICTELSNLTSCITNRLDTCDDDIVKNDVKIAKDILQYMCSAEGRPLVLQLASSDCARNPLLEIQIQVMMHGCLETYTFDFQMEALKAAFSGREFKVSDACPFINQLKTCLIQGATDMCDARMGTFVANVWDIAAGDQFVYSECTQNVIQSRRYVKRALPMLSKRLAAISKLKLKK
ncbi:hypothetical protein PoB_006756300 [Plakobranchus ocellatus]|uniref:Uncharacterized protein n=1 Tax=Plakobranchus ocellatus TaxID=259542 RepID=A0AAV4DA28_9GAST|nr:hypothetical protein PoB_006756300 [Plakobranchus ocellatus]